MNKTFKILLSLVAVASLYIDLLFNNVAKISYLLSYFIAWIS